MIHLVMLPWLRRLAGERNLIFLYQHHQNMFKSYQHVHLTPTEFCTSVRPLFSSRSPIGLMNSCSKWRGPNIQTMSWNSVRNIHWSCFPISYADWSPLMTEIWLGLTFWVILWTILTACLTVAGAVTGSGIE